MSNVPDYRIADLLVGAREGGSNYWVQRIEVVFPDGIEHTDEMMRFLEGDSAAEKNLREIHFAPLVAGGSWTVTEDEEGGHKRHVVTRVEIDKALELLEKKFPRLYEEFITENDDATVADAFLQLACFGDVIYG